MAERPAGTTRPLRRPRSAPPTSETPSTVGTPPASNPPSAGSATATSSSQAPEAPVSPDEFTFPPLSDSPYKVSRGHTERWWYSEGIWLDQGATSAVVGFVWTHWLADRGVEIWDEELGESYARQLQRETRRAMGADEDVNGGARLDVSALILQRRGLIEQCYSVADSASVIDALLERGPVIAGLDFRDSMRQTLDVEGWSVCRVDVDEPVLGGHAVLLNGIALDLTINGVTGFVRFKNSWGRGWGDRGQAMISIEDLSIALGTVGSSLLPIPAASVLRPGLRQDEATEGPPYAPAEERFERSALGSDLWTRRDTVGAGAYADAIARGIQHVETKPPLTIGIKGAWGVGKTSLMRMIRDRLEWPGLDGSSDELRRIHLNPQAARRVAPSQREASVRGAEDLKEVTYRTVLRKLRKGGADSATGDQGAAGSSTALRAEIGPVGSSTSTADEDRWRPTVWFNPWMYQTGEQLWAGLANEIITQVTERMSLVEREHFWLHLNLKRVDEQAVRRKIYGLILHRLAPYALLGVCLLVAGVVVLILRGSGTLGASLAAGGPAAVLAGTAANSWMVLHSKLSAGMADLVEPVARASMRAGDRLAGAYEDLVENPDYRRQSGFLYLLHADIKRVLDLVATPERPLVVFVDDLDRCSPGTVVQVIEAINVFVAGEYRNSIFVIAMEPEMVAAHVEAAYGELVEKLKHGSSPKGQAFDLGWRFLEKIVQLPLTVPAMEPDRTSSFFESLFPGEVTGMGEEARYDGNADVETALEAATLSEAANIAGDIRPDAAAREAVRRVVERRLTTSDPEVRDVISYASTYLQHNPREIKRFVNLFRFYTMIYVERRLEHLPTPASLREVAKLAVLGIRWPGLLRALALPVAGSGADSRTVFELMEAPLPAAPTESQESALKRELAAAGIPDHVAEALTATELLSFLTAGPKVGAGIRGYL